MFLGKMAQNRASLTDHKTQQIYELGDTTVLEVVRPKRCENIKIKNRTLKNWVQNQVVSISNISELVRLFIDILYLLTHWPWQSLPVEGSRRVELN